MIAILLVMPTFLPHRSDIHPTRRAAARRAGLARGNVVVTVREPD
jgi:hypothetical protein